MFSLCSTALVELTLRTSTGFAVIFVLVEFSSVNLRLRAPEYAADGVSFSNAGVSLNELDKASSDETESLR